VALGGRVLASCCAALPPEVLSCRRAPWRQGLNTVGHGGRNVPPWGMTLDVYLSKFLVRPFIFRKQSKINIKNSVVSLTWAWTGLVIGLDSLDPLGPSSGS
jgi:hypothetical protein